MRTTYMANVQNVERKWYVIDAQGQTVGRLASQIATVLRGKHKPTYTPHVDCGDHVIVINADKVVFTGKKLDQKLYRRHTGYAGGLKETKARDMMNVHPERVLMYAVKGMLPKNSLGRQMLTKLRVYAGTEHNHEAQQPETLTFKF
ncbi:MAG: 50S ribosomal protein L13 [Cellulosilyticaceae bacterium]